jgi:hypothetical protein
MDLNVEYAAQQRALTKASCIAGRSGDFHHGLGAAAACAWINAQFANSAQTGAGIEATMQSA